MDELLVAVNPDPESRLRFLIRIPVDGGRVFRTSGTWPRTTALYRHPVGADEWPAEPELVERVAIRSCVRRGAAIDLVLERGRENRSHLVFTRARGRDVVFWQSPRTRKQARPNVRTPTSRGAGIAELQIVVDTRERYGYHFAAQQVTTVKRVLPCGDYGIEIDGRLTAAVVEERYSAVFRVERVRPAVVADGLAELQVRWPAVPIVFVETRRLAEEWTYRYLAAAQVWTETQTAVAESLGGVVGTSAAPPEPVPDVPSTAEVRAWARAAGLHVPDRGRLRPEVWTAWPDAH